MNLTNRTGISKPMFEAIKMLYDNHPAPKEGTYFVTELLRSPKEVILNRKHRDEVTKDVQEVVDAVLGTAWHKAIESLIIGQDDCITETRFVRTLNVDTDFGTMPIEISGAIDCVYADGKGFHIIDWKTCKQMKVDKARSGEEIDWKKQLYLYAWLFEGNKGIRPVDGTINAFPKDMKGKPDFTDSSTWKLQAITYDLSDRKFEEELIDEYKAKLREILNTVLADDTPRECTNEEKWQAEPTFAVKKPEAKTASKVCSSVAEAQKFLLEKGWIGKKYMIYERPSCPTKCQSWCDAYPWCKQGQDAVKAFEAVTAKTFNDKGEEVNG